MIVASIDIGTNTVLLLIAEVNLNNNLNITPIKNEVRMPRIGQGTKKNRIISPDKLELLFTVLEEYKKIIEDHKCDLVILTGTNAFRLASNTSLIISQIKERFNYDLKVITGDEEAEYAFWGALSSLIDISNTLVIDIGGSSTEIISGNKNKILSKVSLQIGSVVATENFLLHTPPLQSEIKKLELEIIKLISNIRFIDRPEKTIAIAGTATTVACMILGIKDFDELLVSNFVIEYKMIIKLLNDIFKLNASDILIKYGRVMQGREDIILAGIVILSQVMKSFGLENVMVSTRGIRYGAIIKYFSK
jgi:exopolyphosphatase/guanosine-5'-triphosphate,3'-diphosphate pyrophosphatase